MLTCSGTNIDYVNEVVPQPLRAKVQLIYHGVNLDGFTPHPPSPMRGRGGGDITSPPLPSWEKGLGGEGAPQIISIGRLVEKKGFPDLIAACAQLRQSGHRFRCAIYGEGPLRAELADLIERLELADDVCLAGERTQAELIPILQAADIFALAPFVTEDGDRDGIPNVLVEAMACGLAVVSTAVAGIPELVRDGENGRLVAPRAPIALAVALGALLGSRQQREQFGAAARATVVEQFDLRAAARRIATLFETATNDE
ncbi:MAG TPA: glycosyltransferase, partial [Roseiflexaceae bacterium]|nr:glycosyltransferase [Roseiflexaceae bacterium]